MVILVFDKKKGKATFNTIIENKQKISTVSFPTFTATLFPSRVWAAWTCAIDALANGTGSNSSKIWVYNILKINRQELCRWIINELAETC